MRWGIRLLLALGVTLGASKVGHAHSFHAGLSDDGRLVISAAHAEGLHRFDPHAPSPPHRPLSAQRHESTMSDLIERAAMESGLAPSLLRAVVQQESAFNPAAVSRAGAAGLMQLMPGTARRFGVHDRFDPAQNLRGGAAYLAWLLRHFNHDIDLALAAYNAGEGSVHRHGNQIPPFAETQAYVRSVRRYEAQWLRKLRAE